VSIGSSRKRRKKKWLKSPEAADLRRLKEERKGESFPVLSLGEKKEATARGGNPSFQSERPREKGTSAPSVNSKKGLVPPLICFLHPTKHPPPPPAGPVGKKKKPFTKKN